MEIGAQLYTVREFCKDLNSFAATLEKVADIGYRTVQVSGTCAYDPAWLRDQLQRTGLRCVLTHTAADRLQSQPRQVCEDHRVFGCQYIGLGYRNFSESPAQAYRDFAAAFRPVAQAIAEGGRYFMYHNHDTEFIHLDGQPILAHMAQDFPAEQMGFTLDTYWVQAGGGDPAAWLERLSGRVPCIHLKDYGFHGRMEAVGEGNINFDRIFQAAEASGTKYMLVEQDNCNGENPFDCLKRSYDYLKAQGFN